MKFSGMIKKADILLFVALVLLGFATLIPLRSGGKAGESVVISVDGQQYGSYPLAVDQVIEVDTEYGHNEVTISGGSVRVSGSDCANHDCEAFGAIRLPRQTVMCLPHRLIITVTGESDIDIVVY